LVVTVHVLVDDCAGYNTVGIRAEHGLSLLVETGKTSILFDTGQSGSWLHNAELMGLETLSADLLVLSHGHFDHTAGLPYFIPIHQRMRLVAHPGCFERKLDDDGSDVGCPLGLGEIEERFRLQLVEESGEIAPGVHLLTSLERRYEDPGTVVYHEVDGRREPDPVWEDSSLVVETESGLLVLCGCAHAGIINIIHAAADLGDDLYAIMGGLHLLESPSKRLHRVVSEMKSLGVSAVYPGHCTGVEATCLMKREMGARRIFAGQSITI